MAVEPSDENQNDLAGSLQRSKGSLHDSRSHFHGSFSLFEKAANASGSDLNNSTVSLDPATRRGRRKKKTNDNLHEYQSSLNDSKERLSNSTLALETLEEVDIMQQSDLVENATKEKELDLH